MKVGFFAFSGYHEKDEDTGRLSGYGYEFLQKIGNESDLTYEYMDYDKSYSDSLDALEKGEIDLLTSVSKTPEREEKFLFSDEPIGVNSTLFTVKAGDERVVPGDYSTYDGLVVGMLDGNSKNDVFFKFAEENGFQFTPKYFETEDELTRALQSGEVDGIVTGSLRATENEWLIESLEPSEFYVVTRKDEPELMAEVNEAIEALDETDPDWREDLNNKYYAVDDGGSVLLSAKERDFLQENGPFTVLVRPDNAPYSYVGEGGVPKGIFPSLFGLMAKRTHLDYEYLRPRNYEDYAAMRDSGAADLVIDVPDDYWDAEREGLKLTDPYFTTTFSMLTLRDTPNEINSVAVPKEATDIVSYVEDTYGSALVLDSAEECVVALLAGRVDGALLYSYVAQEQVRDDERRTLVAEPVEAPAESFSIGVRSHDSHILLAIFNKAISGIDVSVRSSLVNSEVSDGEAPVTLLAFLYANPVYAVIGGAALVALVFVVVLYVYRRHAQSALEAEVEMVSERYEVQQVKLRQALSDANQASEAKTDFLNSMSHDIRTPMNAIIGFTDIALKHMGDDEKVRDCLKKVHVSSEHLLSLINDVLDMSRIESGKVSIETEPVSLKELLEAMRDIVSVDVREKGLHFSFDMDGVRHPWVMCDRLHLNQVLLNLLSNAVKFTMPGGSVGLSVKETCSGEHAARYEFSVFDTGIGMSPEFLEKVFEPFAREKTSTVSGIQGTGLGMSIAQDIMHLMGGEVSVRSELGVGTTFTVVLPLFYADVVTESVEGEGDHEILDVAGRHVLLVEDNALNREIAQEILGEAGFLVDVAVDGSEAVSRVEAGETFDVILMDIQMPLMDGYEATRRIRVWESESGSARVPIIALTADAFADDSRKAEEAGMDAHVAKPIKVSRLMKTLADVLD